LPQGWEHFKK